MWKSSVSGVCSVQVSELSKEVSQSWNQPAQVFSERSFSRWSDTDEREMTLM